MIDTSAFNWQDGAACRGLPMVLFFGPEEEKKADKEIREKAAKSVCAGCDVRSECLDFGMGQKGGIYGGKNADERGALRRRRSRKAPKTKKTPVEVA